MDCISACRFDVLSNSQQENINQMKTRTLIAFCLLLFLRQGFSQTRWQLAKEKNGIKVYTSLDGVSKFKSIKVEAVLAGSIERLISLLSDASTNKDWIYNTNASYLIKRISPTETLSYTETSVPWPASNRDVPINMHLNYDDKNNILKVIAKGVPAAIPEKKGIVRIPFFNSMWNVKYDGKGKLYINYFLEMDPGGSVPAWITNMFVSRGPYETFNNLAAKLK